MGFLIKCVVIGAAVVGIGFWVAEGVERSNVRACLEQLSRQYGTARQHHTYLTDVVEVEVYRSYPDGTSTRFVKYLIQGTQNVQSATCRW